MRTSASLYEEDLVRWSEEQAAAIRAAAASRTNLPLDWENIAEEIETLGRSQRGELRSRTRTLIEHLIKLEVSGATEPRRGWRETVRRTRLEIEDLLRLSPSLRREMAETVDDVRAAAEMLAIESLVDAGEEAATLRTQLKFGRYTVEQVFGSWLPHDPAH